MERKPLNSFSSESSTEGSTEPDSEKVVIKKKSLRHVPLSAPPSETSAEKPKPTLFESLASAEPDPESETSSVETSETSPEEVINSEEVQYISQEIAGEHLQAIQQADPETAEALQPATEFLERVQAGVDTETAFNEVAAELGLEENEVIQEIPEANEAVPYEDSSEDEPEAEADNSDQSAGSGGGASNNSTPVGGGGFAAGSGSGPSGGYGGSHTASPNVMPTAAAEYYDNRRNNAGQLLLVGMVGYLIGRRRGRIKAEKRLQPVQQKLEKQVSELEQDITRKEQQLIVAKARLSERGSTAQPNVRVERPVPTSERMQPSRTESRLDIQKPARAEHLGHMVVAAEAPSIVEKVKFEKPNSIRQAFRPEQVKDMKRGELLELSEKIVVEGASLRRIYESRLIGEKQLRHLVSEYLQGKDIAKDLRKEMVEHEIDFERDPILRDRIRSRLNSDRGGSGGLSDLLAGAGIVDDVPNTQLARQIQKEEAHRAAIQHKHKQQRMATDLAMITAVVVLSIAVTILALRG